MCNAWLVQYLQRACQLPDWKLLLPLVTEHIRQNAARVFVFDWFLVVCIAQLRKVLEPLLEAEDEGLGGPWCLTGSSRKAGKEEATSEPIETVRTGLGNSKEASLRRGSGASAPCLLAPVQMSRSSQAPNSGLTERILEPLGLRLRGTMSAGTNSGRLCSDSPDNAAACFALTLKRTLTLHAPRS